MKSIRWRYMVSLSHTIHDRIIATAAESLDRKQPRGRRVDSIASIDSSFALSQVEYWIAQPG